MMMTKMMKLILSVAKQELGDDFAGLVKSTSPGGSS